ncbi:MAG: hypothetical protein Q9211_005537 [Gyalolechia sp. 1 TL-2023]
MTSQHNTSSNRSRFTFSQDWFHTYIIQDWTRLALPLRSQQLQILEIGAFEGGSTTWILDNLMSHPDSTLTVIDTFEGGMEHRASSSSAVASKDYALNSLESRFKANVELCLNANKVLLLKSTSYEALLRLSQGRTTFDLIYIDGSHTAIDVLTDAVLSWHLLRVGGKLVFDDWMWKGFMEECYNPRIAIKGFLRCVKPEVEIVETEYQMWITRVANRLEATPNPDPEVRHRDAEDGIVAGEVEASCIHG